MTSLYYVTASALARRYNVTQPAVFLWRRRYKTPPPDAFVANGSRMTPLWNQASLPAWDAWYAQHAASKWVRS